MGEGSPTSRPAVHRRSLLLAPLGFAASGTARAEWLRDGIVIYAETPLEPALRKLGGDYARAHPGQPTVFSGPPLQLILLLAHKTQGDVLIVQPDFMARAAGMGLVTGLSRPLWRNRLVIAGGRGAGADQAFSAAALAAALRGGILAVPDATDASPVDGPALIGKLGVNVRIQGTATTGDALDMVRAGTASLALCHATELHADSRLTRIMTLPDDAYPPILYQAALTKAAWSRYQQSLLRYFAIDAAPFARQAGLEVLA